MRNIILFLLISLASGWIGVWIDKSIEPQAEGNSLGMGVWLLLPFLTSVFFRFFITNAWSDLKFNIQKNGKWYLLSLLIFPLTTLLILLLGNALGWVKFSNFQFHVYLASLGNILIPIFIKNILEEFAWRGYLTSRLAQFKMKDIWIYLIAGGTWGVWHFPYYLFFLPKSQMLANLPFASFTFAIVGVFTMLCWSILFTELYFITQSIWAIIILHTMGNAFLNPLIIDGHVSILSGKEIFFNPTMGLIPSFVYVFVGLWLRNVRMKVHF